MVGEHVVEIYTTKVHYKFTLDRSVTVIRGDSATGKTTLFHLVSQFENNGNTTGVTCVCDKSCIALSSERNWKLDLVNIHDSIVFIDKESRFYLSTEFASIAMNSSNYYVIITREHIKELPYSIDSIYEIHSSGKYNTLVKYYKQLKIKEVEDNRC